MRRGVLALAAGLAAAALALTWLLRGDGSHLPEGGLERSPPAARAPAVAEPTSLATREPAARDGRAGPATEPPTPDGPSGTLSVELRYPPLPPRTLVSLRLAQDDDGPRITWHHGTDAALESPAATKVEIRPGARTDALRIGGLAPGRRTAIAEAGVSAPRIAVSEPVEVDVTAAGGSAVLELIPASHLATIAFAVTDGGDPVPGARIQMRVGGTYWPSARTEIEGRAEVVVPPATVRAWIDAFPGIALSKAPPAQELRVARGERREIRFEVPPTVGVRFRGVAADGADAGHGIAGIWRLDRGARPVYTGLIQRAGSDGPAYRLPPGRYGVSLSAREGFAQAWHEFTMGAEPSTTIAVVRSGQGRRIRLRVRAADGGPPGDPGTLALVRRATHPADLSAAFLELDAEGRTRESPPLADGVYEVGLWKLHLHRRIEVSATSTDHDLRLPPAAQATGRLVGSCEADVAARLRAQAIGTEWMVSPTHVRPDGYEYAALPAGSVVLRAEPDAYAADDFRHYEATLRVTPDVEMRHDVGVERR